ncbi:MAG: hypothetical protein ABI723_21640 [Bacteroidia bacterium]
MKHTLTAIIIYLVFASGFSFGQQYSYTADLINIADDRVKVTCIVPRQTNKKIDFIFPNLIPGSYAYKEYGRYIEDFVAYDENGKKLKVKKADKYNFSIQNADRLFKVEYYVNDSWEEKNGKHFIFQPGGTNIEAGKNFVINQYGFFGYMEGMKNLPFEITFLKPENLTGYSYLEVKPKDKTTDILNAPGYDILVDNPVLYCAKNESEFKIGKSTIDICVYSETGKVDASLMAEVVKPVGYALENFFGTLPVDHYLFMFYLADPANVPERKGKGLGSGFGALEHNHCSFYFMPEHAGLESNKKNFQDVCSHEFLHILTPLNLHSHEIEDFNFRVPVMSQHLWMYEGATEYFSQLVLMHDSLIAVKDFMKEMRSKMNRSAEFDQFSMTDMSKNVVEPENQKRYLSVYSRGALLAMMLDILIIDRSDGNNSLHQVMMKLAEKYGDAKPFNDNDLINEIVDLTYPEVKNFFDRYITGKGTPDYATYFNLIGYDYHIDYPKEIYYFGPIGMAYNEQKKEFRFLKSGENLFGIKEGDVLLTVNYQDADIDNIDQLYGKYFSENESPDPVFIEIRRGADKLTLKASPQRATKHIGNYIKPMDKPEPKALKNFKKFSGVEFSN